MPRRTIRLTDAIDERIDSAAKLRGYSSPSTFIRAAIKKEPVEQVDLAASGLHFKLPPSLGLSIPSVVGPFNYFDLRATLTQTVADMTAWNNYRSAKENLRANQLSGKDARDLVVLAVGGAYLQVIAAAARVNSARAQLETANALYQQTAQQRSVGLVAQIDVNRSRIQMLTEQQRLASLQNDLGK
jgi:outer membrane protein TolC